jgi:catechol 2,3-dioxygenase-like lactoylglutathione lyase family enzyme
MATTTSTKVKALDASYYTVKDLEKQTRFYTSLLGFEPTLTVPNLVAEWTFPGGGTFGIYKSEMNISSGSGALFAVDDVAAAVAEHKSRGVEFDQGGSVDESPACYMAFGKDAEGLTFLIHKRKDGTCG